MTAEMDVSIVITGHNEGLLSASTIRSALQAARRAEAEGFTVECLAVLDRADADTVAVFEYLAAGFRLVETDFGDPGMARNAGVAISTSRAVAFLDADDLWGESWLAAANIAARADPRLIVWHPEISLYFGASELLFRHVDMEDPYFDLAILPISNYWTALSFAPRRLLIDHPFPPTDPERQLGYEDWSWNMQVIAAGALHKVVRGTGHLIRVKNERSTVREAQKLGSRPHPTMLFRDILEERRNRGIGSV
jgi:glycosyltransferase involved in cell wall biosynthesis